MREVVYKYYKFEDGYSLSNLEKEQIYFPLTKLWYKENEIEFEYITNSETELFEYFLNDANKLKEVNYNLYNELKKNHPLQKENPNNEFNIEELMLYSATSFFKLKEIHERSFRERLLNNVAIFSTSDCNINSHLWKKFANDGSGFCVGYKKDCIEVKAKCYNVNYTNEVPKVDFIKSQITEKSYYPLYRLPQVYKDEQEIRFLKVFDGSFRKYKDECIMKLNPTDIVSITAGFNIEPENLEKLKAIAQIHYPHIQVKIECY